MLFNTVVLGPANLLLDDAGPEPFLRRRERVETGVLRQGVVSSNA